MAKGSRRLVLGFLLVFVSYLAILRCNISPPIRIWKLEVAQHLASFGTNETKNLEINDRHTKFLLRRLVGGRSHLQLNGNDVACISDTESDTCITSTTSKLTTGSSPVILHLDTNEEINTNTKKTPNAFFQVRPYARKTDTLAMARTSPVILLPNNNSSLICDIHHSVPAIVFSTGGFAGNFFHDINDVIIPLFLTTAHFRSRVQFVVTDYEEYWAHKYRSFLSRLSAFDIIIASSTSSPVDTKVHCFPTAIVGLKYHGNLLCNSTLNPKGISTNDFRNFLHRSFSLQTNIMVKTNSPIMVLLSRGKSRTMLNEESVMELATQLGFKVILAKQEMMSNLTTFAKLVNRCNVLMGVHGAGMTNLLFLRRQAVLLQVVPWGLDWASKAYYGRPARRLGLQYVEYHIEVNESSLYDKYPIDHPVLTDPWGVNLKGYNVSKPVYTDGQNVRLNLSRFKETLLSVKELVRIGTRVTDRPGPKARRARRPSRAAYPAGATTRG